MSAKFVCFINAHTRKPILVNPDHVRTATEADSHKTVRLVIGEAAEEVEGDLKSVWETLTGGSHPQAPDEHLTWTRRDPEVDRCTIERRERSELFAGRGWNPPAPTRVVPSLRLGRLLARGLVRGEAPRRGSARQLTSWNCRVLELP
jgi:hypothetical protein